MRWLAVLALAIATLGVTTATPAAAFSDCWTSTTSWSATINCYTLDHQAHVGCRTGPLGFPTYVHGPVRTTAWASTAACPLGKTRFTHWYTIG